MDESVLDLLSLAERLAKEAGGILALRSVPLGVERKSDDSVVTDADRALQTQIVRAIHSRFPDHAVLAEETLADASPSPKPVDARFVWVIDPLDGTRNYAVGFPCFSTSIAVVDRGMPIVGVVYEHNLARIYVASHGGGAWRDGRRIRAGGSTVRHDHLIGIGSSKDALNVRVLQSWVATKGLILRNVGSAAMHLALVADGGLNAAFGVQAKIWDLAAGLVLVAEAGGRITDPAGCPLVPFDFTRDPNLDIPFLAGEPSLHERLIRSIGGAPP